MKLLRKTMPVIALVLVSANLPASAPAHVPGTQPIRATSHSGDTDPRSTAMCRLQILVEQPGYRYTTEVLLGRFGAAEFALTGYFVDEDGFNTLSRQSPDSRAAIPPLLAVIPSNPYGHVREGEALAIPVGVLKP